MTHGGLFCPVEECDQNHGGHCGVRGDAPLGFAAAAFYMPGQSSFMAPFSPMGGMIGLTGQPPMADTWGMWRNCPRLNRSEDPRMQ